MNIWSWRLSWLADIFLLTRLVVVCPSFIDLSIMKMFCRVGEFGDFPSFYSKKLFRTPSKLLFKFVFHRKLSCMVSSLATFFFFLACVRTSLLVLRESPGFSYRYYGGDLKLGESWLLIYSWVSGYFKRSLRVAVSFNTWGLPSVKLSRTVSLHIILVTWPEWAMSKESGDINYY